ncbi:uncharacterized protein LOC110117399 [Athalia rosae]|uniref:uncharacterized protein LOC110117399 n=1 Tax=Athalia rosae TaxID=37344 RepID=UPI0020344997|nr:uncharacterized protein LOC110117399 [Athalia rosae]
MLKKKSISLPSLVLVHISVTAESEVNDVFFVSRIHNATDMQSLVCCAFLVLIAIESSTAHLKKLMEHRNHRSLEFLDSLLDASTWASHDFLMLLDEKMADLDDEFFKHHTKFTWTIIAGEHNSVTNFSNIILFAKNFATLNETLNVIDILSMDGRSKLVIILRENFADLNDVRKASNGSSVIMWKLDKTDVIYVVPCKQDVLIMTYFPFAKNCQPGDLEILDVWKNRNFEKGAKLFPKKMLDGQGCVQYHTVVTEAVLRLEARKEVKENGEMVLGGVAGHLLAIVSEKMNMPLKLLPEDAATWGELLEKVQRSEAILTVSGIIPSAARLKNFDLTSTYMQDAFGFAYRIQGFDIPWKNLASPLSQKVWTYVGYSLLLFCGLIILARRYGWSNAKIDRLRVLDAVGMLLGMSRTMPKNNIGRYLCGMWIIYSILIDTTYTSGLVSFLTTPNENHIIRTLEELSEDGMQFGDNDFHRSFYYDPSDSVMMKIYDNYKFWTVDETNCILYNGKGAAGILYSTLVLHNAKYAGEAGKQLRMLNDNALTFQAAIALRRGSPFVVGVHHYVFLAVQSGFHDYWLNYYLRKPIPTRLIKKTPSAMTLRHLRGIFCLNVIGNLLASVVFIGELVIHKML